MFSIEVEYLMGRAYGDAPITGGFSNTRHRLPGCTRACSGLSPGGSRRRRTPGAALARATAGTCDPVGRARPAWSSVVFWGAAERIPTAFVPHNYPRSECAARCCRGCGHATARDCVTFPACHLSGTRSLHLEAPAPEAVQRAADLVEYVGYPGPLLDGAGGVVRLSSAT
jgi:hypothetical protein